MMPYDTDFVQLKLISGALICYVITSILLLAFAYTSKTSWITKVIVTIPTLPVFLVLLLLCMVCDHPKKHTK